MCFLKTPKHIEIELQKTSKQEKDPPTSRFNCFSGTQCGTELPVGAYILKYIIGRTESGRSCTQTNVEDN